MKALSKAQAEIQLWKSRYETEGMARVEELEGGRSKLQARIVEAEENVDSLQTKIANIEKSKARLASDLAERSKQGALIYNLAGEFTHPIRTVKYTAKAEASARKYLLALDVLPDATAPEHKTFFKVDIINDSNGEMLNLKADTIIGHPSLEKPL